MKIQAVVTGALAMSLASSCWAADRLVPSQYTSIQAAVNAAVDGDRVLLAPGIYNEQVTIDNKSITISSSGGPSVTKIDRQGSSGTVFYVPGSASKTVSIEGVTMTRWYEYSLLVHSEAPSIRLRNVRCFQGGPVLYLRNGADATVEDSSMILVGTFNSSDLSPIRGYESGSNITLRRSDFQGTRAYYGSVARTTSGGAILVEDCRLSGCYARYRGGCFLGDGDATVTMRRTSVSNCRSSDEEGGGVIFTYSGAVLVSECDVSGLYAYRIGAFILSESGAVTLQRTTVRDSSTYGYSGWDEAGGYVHVGAAPLLVQDCTFRNLYASGCYLWGGVIGSRTAANHPVTITGTRFENCGSENYCSGRWGRVIYSYHRPLTVSNCTFSGSGNGSGSRYGGAIAVEGGSVSIADSSFVDQRATERGGAIYLNGPISGSIAECSFVRCLSASGAVALEQGADGNSWSVMNCEFSGCGIYNWSSRPMSVSGCSFVRDPSFADARIESYGAPASIEHSVFQNSGGGASVMLGGSNYAVLSACAFCRTASQEISQYFFEKLPCTFGADCSVDCDADGVSDLFEITSGSATDCNSDGIPDNCQHADGATPDCNNNGVFDVCEIVGGTAADCDGNLVPDSCQPDCDSDGVPDVCEIAAGAPDCNLNGIPDACEPDCDGDGIPNACEIASGAADCDGDGVPDACEIASNPTFDLNSDCVLDSCQPEMQFAGLQLEIVPIRNRGTDDLFPSGAVCYRLYARVTDPAASVTGIYGNTEHPLVLGVTGGFWQSPYGANFSNQVPCSTTVALPSYKYDSWFGIGLDCGDGNATQQQGMDLAAFNAGGPVSDSDGIVYVVPGSPQAVGGDSRRVLLAQLTSTQPVFPSGRVNLVGSSSFGMGEAHSWRAFAQPIPMPALVDCNGNGEHDAFDIARGVALDCDQSGVPDTCEYPSASTDCNGNGISDLCDCHSGFSSDLNSNNIPDECECSGDVDANGRVDVDDLVWVLVSWGDGPESDADLNSDGIVNGVDLVIVLTGWGSCL